MNAFIFAFLLMAGTVSGWAESAWSVRAELLVVRVPEAAGLRLRPILREANSIEAGMKELRAMIAGGQAELVAAPVSWTLGGQRDKLWHLQVEHGVSESVEEFRYPADSNTPQPPQFPSSKPERILSPRSPTPPFSVPTAFETRNIGVTLEFAPEVAPDGKTIHMAVIPQHVTLEGFTRLYSAPGEGDDWRYRQPKVRMLRPMAQFDVRSGEWILTNVSILREPAPSMEFCLMRAMALAVNP